VFNIIKKVGVQKSFIDVGVYKTLVHNILQRLLIIRVVNFAKVLRPRL